MSYRHNILSEGFHYASFCYSAFILSFVTIESEAEEGMEEEEDWYSVTRDVYNELKDQIEKDGIYL